jgi:hypothetical protein
MAKQRSGVPQGLILPLTIPFLFIIYIYRPPELLDAKVCETEALQISDFTISWTMVW